MVTSFTIEKNCSIFCLTEVRSPYCEYDISLNWPVTGVAVQLDQSINLAKKFSNRLI